MSQVNILDVVNNNPQIPTQFDGDTGSAIPIGNVLNIFGTNGITTVASGMTVSVNGVDATYTTKGVASFNSAQFTVVAGAVSLSGGSAAETLTGNDAVVVNPSAGNINVLGTGTLRTTGAGSTLTLGFTGLVQHAIQVAGTGSNLTQIGPSATAGQVLQSGGAGGDPAFSIPTYPSASGTSGKILISDGTNNVYSTPTYPNASVTSGKIIISDGTNYIASTPTFPNSASGTGTILRADGTNWVATTSTYPTTNAVSTLLYASSSNVMSALATANSAVLVTTSAGVPVYSSTMTNGQVIIGVTSGTPSASTLTSGTGVSITNGSGSITINAVGSGLTWTVVTGDASFTANTGTIANKSGLLTMTLPASGAIGDVISITGINTALGWKIAQNANQQIFFGTSSTTVGVTGSIASINIRDSLSMVCVVSGSSTVWNVTSSIGNLTVA